MRFDPFTFDPCAARASIERIIKSRRFFAEAKLDGVRAILSTHLHSGKFEDAEQRRTTLTGRRTSDRTGSKLDKIDHVPHIKHELDDIVQLWQGGQFVLDGELCYTTPGSNSNNVVAIMGSAAEKAVSKQKDGGYLTFVLFDVLCFNGNDLRNEPFNVRRQARTRFMNAVQTVRANFIKEVPSYHSGMWHPDRGPQASEYIDAAFENALIDGYEGLILKSADGMYHQQEWAKVKSKDTYDFVIMGYDESESETFAGNGIAALRLGLYDSDGGLHFVTCCSGMTHDWRRKFHDDPKDFLFTVVEIEGQQMFKDTGAIRHPRFVKLRPDLRAIDQTYSKYGIAK